MGLLRLILKHGFFIPLLPLLTSCNFFESFGDKTTNEVMLIEAQRLLNDKDYDNAILKFQQLDADFLDKREVKILYASAYAGRCGLDFLSLASSLKDNPSAKFFKLLFDVFPSSTVTRVTDCLTAQELVLEISAAASGRTANENLFLAFVSFSKMGAIFNTYGDLDQNKTLDAGFDPCTAGDISNANVAEIGTAFALGVQSLNAASEAGVASDQLEDITAVCAALAAIPPAGTYDDICTETNATTVAGNAVLLKGIRSMMNESSAIGLGVCTGNLATCLCP